MVPILIQVASRTYFFAPIIRSGKWGFSVVYLSHLVYAVTSIRKNRDGGILYRKSGCSFIGSWQS